MRLRNKLLILPGVLLVFFSANLTALAQGATLINTDKQEDVDNLFVIDADDTGGDVKLQFGGTVNKYLLWDTTNSQFSFNANVSLEGNEIKDFKVENSASAPLCDATYPGRMYHNTVDTKTYVCDGTNWVDITAIFTTATKVVTVGSVNSDYANIANAAGYLNTLSGGIMLLSAETHQITNPVNLRNITIIGKDDSNTIIQISGNGQIDSFDTAFKNVRFDINAINDSMAIDVATGSNSLSFEWVDFDIQDSGDSLIDSNSATAPTVIMKFIKCDESGGNGTILKTIAGSNLNSASSTFVDSRSADNSLQMSDWDVSLVAGGNVYTTGTIYSIPANSIIVSPNMNLQGAIDSLESTGNGGLITLLPGTHSITQPLTVEGDNIQIVGYGDSSIVSASGFSGITDETAALQIGVANGTNPADDVVLRDFKVEVSSDIHGIRVAGGADNQIYNVTVQKMTGASGTGAAAKMGIQLLDGSTTDLVRPVVKNSRVFGNGAGNYFTDGIHVTSDSRISGVWGYGNRVLNALVEGNNVDYVRETGYVFVGADDSSLFNNRASRMGVGGTSAYGIFMGNISNINMNANVFSGSLSTEAIGIGIDTFGVTGGSSTVDSIFNANIIDGEADGGVGFRYGFMIGDTTNTQVYRNSFENNSVLGASNSAGTTYAFTVDGDADDNTFSNNNISGGTNPWDEGITLSSTAQERNQIQENRFTNVTLVTSDASTDSKVDSSAHREPADPTVNDDRNDGYYVGTVWVNTSTQESWILVDSAVGAAVWNRIDDSGGAISGTDSNTFTLDQDNTGGDTTLQFGTSLSHYLKWDSVANTFVFSNDVDFGGNELIDFNVENVAVLPTCDAASAGRLIHYTVDSGTYVCNGTSWIQIDQSSAGSTLAAVQARRTTDFTLAASNTYYDIDLDTTDVETNSATLDHDATTSDRIIAKKAGTYKVTYQVTSNDTTATHGLDSRVRVNDTTVVPGSELTGIDYQNEYVPISANFLVTLNANDYITLQAQRTTANTIIGQTTLTVVKLDGVEGPAGPAYTPILGQFYNSTGGQDVNTTSPVAIPLNQETRKDSGVTHSTVTNNSRVYLDSAGWYEVTYNVSHENQTTNRKNIRCNLRLNGTTNIIPSDSYSYSRNTTDEWATNTATALIQTSSANEYYEVMCNGEGSNVGSAAANTVANQSWTLVEKK